MDRSRTATRDVYNDIAAHFAETREYPWPEVTAFLEAAPAGRVGLDLGCGNGRHLPPLAECVEVPIGIDLSTELLQIASGRDDVDAELVAGDAANLPLADDSVAVAIAVAAIHHLPTHELRRRSLDELARVLEPGGGGRALVSVWSTEHERFDAEDSFDAELEWELPDGETVDRFYHVYEPAAFEAELAESELQLLDFEVSSGNCYATVTVE